jgi:uncharacterized protein (TIGR02118 family)
MGATMIVVSVMYPHEPGKHFDMDYYLATHIPLVKDKMGDGLKGVSVEKGLAGMPPGSPAVYATVGRLLLDSLEDVQTCLAPNDAAFAADIPNFTDITPRIQISEVVL